MGPTIPHVDNTMTLWLHHHVYDIIHREVMGGHIFQTLVSPLLPEADLFKANPFIHYLILLLFFVFIMNSSKKCIYLSFIIHVMIN